MRRLRVSSAPKSAKYQYAYDGGRLRVIVMIRDDFAIAAARFMNALDVPIVQGVDFATVDLFDVDHAAKVIIRFGHPPWKDAIVPVSH